jgi:branched-chain amino acid transport system permease protein
VNPDIFPITLSIYLVVGLAVGGLGSLGGLIVGAGLIFFLQNHADTVARWVNHLPAVNLDPKQLGIPSIVFGAVLILVMLILPTGAGGLLRKLLGPRTTRMYSKS